MWEQQTNYATVFTCSLRRSYPVARSSRFWWIIKRLKSLEGGSKRSLVNLWTSRKLWSKKVSTKISGKRLKCIQKLFFHFVLFHRFLIKTALFFFFFFFFKWTTKLFDNTFVSDKILVKLLKIIFEVNLNHIFCC